MSVFLLAAFIILAALVLGLGFNLWFLLLVLLAVVVVVR